MIFLTLGTQLPFDRLARAVDAAAAGLDEPVFAQIGRTDYRPQNMEFTAFLTPREAAGRFETARLIVGHAGIGTILSAMRAGKPLVVMARRADLGEHRNDHQAATVSQISRIRGVRIAETEAGIAAALAEADPPPLERGETAALTRLIGALRAEIFGSS